MIYTEVLPFVWLGVTLGAVVLITLASTLSVFSPAAPRIGAGGWLPWLNWRGPTGVPFVDSAYCPSFLEYLVKQSYGSLLSQWWFWPPYLYFVVKVSHSIARGRDCHRLQRRTNLSGKVAIVTGANSGIGYYTALQLAEMGATVILACRSEAKSQATARQICDEIVWKRGGRKVGGGITNAPSSGERKEIEGEERSGNSSAVKKGMATKVYSKHGYEIQLRTDFSIEMDDFVSVKRFCSRFLAEGLPLHFLVNNAGMMVTDLQFSKFNPDLELHAAVNFMGPLLLTDLLWEKLCETSLELSRAATSIDVRASGVKEQTHRAPPNTSSASGEDDEDENSNPLAQGLPPCFTMTRSRVIFVASEAHQFPNMDSSFIWRNKVSKRPRNNAYSTLPCCSPMLEVLQNASKGKSSSKGPIIAPRVSKTMAGFVRYGFSKLFDIYLAHHFVNRGAPASVTELLRVDSTPFSPSPATSPTKAAVAHPPGLQITPLVVALHPGLIASSFANNILSVYKYLTSVTLAFQKTSEEGSQTTVYACICNEADAMPHPREANPYWRDESPPSRRRESETSGGEGTNANNTANKYLYAARYLAECEDYSFSAMKPIAWSLEDARDVVEWARKNVLKTA